MGGVPPAAPAVLAQLQAIGVVALVLLGRVVALPALAALQGDDGCRHLPISPHKNAWPSQASARSIGPSEGGVKSDRPVGRPGLRLLAAATGIQVTVTAPWDGMTVSLPTGPGSPGSPVVLVYVKVQLRLVPPPSAFDRRGPAARGALVPSDRHANPSGQVVAQSPSGKSAGWTSWPSEPSGRWW